MSEKFVNINDRSDFVDALSDLLTSCHAKHKSGCFAPNCKDCIDRFFGVSNGHLLPAADVAPVRHGHWINENFYTRCSVCGKMAIYDKYGQEVESDFCPKCGAIMDGEEK